MPEETNKNKVSILDRLHNIERYRAQVDAIYRMAAKEAAAIATTIDTELPEDMFSFADYPKTKKLVDDLIESCKADILAGKIRTDCFKNNDDVKERISFEHAPIEQIFEDRNIVKIDINGFRKKYLNNIPIDIFIQLGKLLRQDITSTEIPLSLYEDIKNRKIENDRIGERIAQTAKANNEGSAFEKNGDIDKAIERYEWNIYENHCEALHSFNRLIVLYGKRKDEANKRRILEKGIEVFENIHPQIADAYRAKLSAIVSPTTKI